MKTIEFKATYANGDEEIIEVYARDINSGFQKAARRANERLASGRQREIHSVEFVMVKS